jgi:FdhD protein
MTATVTVIRNGSPAEDFVAVEEPLTIQISHGPLNKRTRSVHAMTMRSPGHDAELAIGWLASDGVIRERSDVVDITTSSPDTVRVQLHPDRVYDAISFGRQGMATSACGLCGRQQIDHWAEAIEPMPIGAASVASKIIRKLPEMLRERQTIFHQTGGTHAAAAFVHGEIEAIREDVGRHNALDKLVGQAWLFGRTLSVATVAVSARASFELVQKAGMARAAILVAVGAPTSAAITLADRIGLTLVGFAKATDFNVYTHAERIAP